MKCRNLKIRSSKEMWIPSGEGRRTKGTRRRRATLEYLCGVKYTPEVRCEFKPSKREKHKRDMSDA
jgi:hypothetical protein